MPVKAIPDGYHSLTPYIISTDAPKLLKFLKEAFGATELFPPMTLPDGTIKHAELKVGDSPVMIAQACGEAKPTSFMLYFYVEDVDAVYKKAVQSGGTSIKEPEDQFYGDRSGGVIDPVGNQWWIATHKEDVTPEECEQRMKAAYKEKAHV